MDMKKILFLCTGNSCRSQMAEGLCRYLHSSIFDCQSAGIEAHGLNPNAVKVMGEIGIDISSQESKTLNQLPDLFFDYVITVCGHADENCPIFPYGAKKIHIGFDDPAKLTIGLGYEEMLQVFRRIRDEIGDRIKHLPDLLNGD